MLHDIATSLDSLLLYRKRGESGGELRDGGNKRERERKKGEKEGDAGDRRGMESEIKRRGEGEREEEQDEQW